MICIYSIEDNTKWDDIVSGFANYDVYYLSGYVKAFQIHGDGDPQLLGGPDPAADGGRRGIHQPLRHHAHRILLSHPLRQSGQGAALLS